MKKEQQVLVYKKYLNKSSGTIIYLTDSVYEKIGNEAPNLLHRLDSEIYTLEKGKYIPVQTMQVVNTGAVTPVKKKKSKSKTETSNEVEENASVELNHSVDSILTMIEESVNGVDNTNKNNTFVDLE